MTTDGFSNPDVVLVGGGIMSATLASLLGIVAPDWTIEVFESGTAVAAESSGPWNNAGTGHSALCELNYTPARPDGSVDPTKAVAINEQFQVSRQFWSHLVRAGAIDSPKAFISSVPHISFVSGAEGRAYMRNRYAALAPQPLFAGLEYSDDPAELADWVPLMMAGRSTREPVAATRSLAGTDVNFGALTHLMLDAAGHRQAVRLHLHHRVLRVRRDRDGLWATTVREEATGERRTVRSRFLFVGAGGGALPLLQGARIPEIRGYGGFPVSGRFLRTRNPELVAQHRAKVYGRAKVGAPPMSVPHLDLRAIDGEQALMFGPYAGFSPRFLKAGSRLDLPRSLRGGNLGSMLGAGRANIPLTRYLLGQVLQSEKARFRALEEFVPTAISEDWDMITAGQRVQVIKQDPHGRGVLQFGTELIVGADGTVAGLLGASPGASTATSTMLTLLERCFPERIDGWRPLLQEAIPSYGHKLSEEPALLSEVFAETTSTLELHP